MLQMFLLLPLIYYVIFHYIPMYGVTVAFKDFKFMSGILGSPWIGFDNFRRFFEYPHVWRLIRNTFLINIYSLFFSFPAPIILAVALNEVMNQPYKRFVQTVSYLPHFISSATIVGLLTSILSPSSGFVNKLITALGGEAIYFMLRPEWFRTLYIGSGIWQNVGWGAIIYLAALSRVEVELHESATIDGCGRLRRIRHIDLVAIRPVIIILFLLNLGRLLSVGAEKIILMYNPSTYETADVISSFVFRRGIQGADFSFGAAVGLFSTVVNVVLLVSANTISRRVSETSLW